MQQWGEGKEKAKFRGSFTVEAAFLLPIVLIIFIMLILIVMYLHDKIVVYTTMETCLNEMYVYILYDTKETIREIDLRQAIGRKGISDVVFLITDDIVGIWENYI